MERKPVKWGFSRKGLIVLVAVLVCFAGCIWWFVNLFRAGPNDAMWFDPWLTNGDRRRGDRAMLTSRTEIQDRLPYTLAKGPGLELKLEARNRGQVSTRITYGLPNGLKYRIVQYPKTAATGLDFTSPAKVFRGLAINAIPRNERAAFWSPSWSEATWVDPDLGYVWIASDTVSMKELIGIAVEVIEAKRKGTQPHAKAH